MNALELILTLGLPTLVGAGFCAALGLGRARIGTTAWLGLAHALGAGATGLVVWAWALAELPLERSVLVPALLGAAALPAAWARRRGRARRGVDARPTASQPGPSQPESSGPDPSQPVRPRPGSRLERLCFLLVLVGVSVDVVDRAVVANAAPIVRGDEAGQFYARARVVAEAEGIGAGYHAALERRSFVNGMNSATIVVHRDYPVLVPMLEVWSFVAADRVLWSDARVPAQALTLALVLVAAGALRAVARPGVAALVLLALASTRTVVELGSHGRPDVACGLGFLIAVCGLVVWRHGPVVGLGLGLAVFAKNEGVLLTVALYAALAVVALLDRRAGLPAPRPATLVAGLLPLLLFAADGAWDARHGYGNDLLGENREGRSFLALAVERAGERVGPVLEHFAADVWLAPYEGRLLWVAALVLVVATPALRRRPETRAPLLAIALFQGGLILIFLGTFFDLAWHLDTAAARVAWQALPALALILATQAAALWPAREG